MPVIFPAFIAVPTTLYIEYCRYRDHADRGPSRRFDVFAALVDEPEAELGAPPY